MPRRLVTSYTHRNNVIAQAGDSQTDNYTLMVPPLKLQTEVLAASLRALGGKCKARIFGQSGQTSTQGLARIAELTRYEVATVAILAYGANDPGNSIVAATTQANIEAMCTALTTAGVTRIVILSLPYLNYSASAGDTLATPYATYATVRAAQLAAQVAAQAAHPTATIVFCDLYAYLRALIVAGTETQGSFSWHVADNNQHLNAAGHAYAAAALLATIQAQSGWLTALSAA